MILLAFLTMCAAPAPPSAASAPTSAAPAPTVIEAAPMTSTAAASKIVRVAVMDLKLGDGIPVRMGRIVADNLVAEIRKLEGVTVVSMDELRSMLDVEAGRQSLGCDEKNSCLAEITEALGADVVITGSIADLEGARVLSLRKLEQKSAAVTAEVNERLVAAGGEEVLAALGPAVVKLFPDAPLKRGETRGVGPEKARLLNPPPLPTWSTLSVAGVSLVALAGAVGVGVAASNEADGLQAQIDASPQSPVQGKLVLSRQARVDDLALTANILYGTAAVGALAAAGMALVTDWTGARAVE